MGHCHYSSWMSHFSARVCVIRRRNSCHTPLIFSMYWLPVVLPALALCLGAAAAEVVVCTNTSDCTIELQAALQRSAEVVVNPTSLAAWPVRPLSMRSHSRLTLQGGVELVALHGGFGSADCLLTIEGVTNVTLHGEGGGGVLRMRKSEYAQAGLTLGQMHVVSIVNSSDVRVEGLALVEGGGDGIYVAGHVGKSPRPANLLGSQRVVLRDLVSSNNTRNGASLIACIDCLVERCRFEHTGDGVGSEPMSGVDLEPNRGADCLSNVTLRDCSSVANGGGGFELYAGRWAAPKELPPLPLNVTFQRLYVDGGGTRACRRVPNSPGCGGLTIDLLQPGLRGRLTVRDVHVHSTADAALSLGGVAADGAALDLARLTLFHNAAPATTAAISIVPGLPYALGGIRIRNSTVVAPLAPGQRQPPRVLAVSGFNGSFPTRDIDISVRVMGAAACAAARAAPKPPGVRTVVSCADGVIAPCYNGSDCREQLQAVLDFSGAGRITLPVSHAPQVQTGNAMAVYPLREPGLRMRSNQLVKLEAGVALEAAPGAFVAPPPGKPGPTSWSMVLFHDVVNVSLLGYGAIIAMRKLEYDLTKPCRMGVVLRNCSDITVAGLRIESTGGDGVYIGRNHAATDPACNNQTTACHGVARSILIKDVASRFNARQGMSIVAAQDVTVRNSEFSFTSGACPQAGIDIEPSSADEPLHNVSLINITCANNTGAQLQMPVDPSPLLPGGLPLLISIDGAHLYGANWSAHQDGCSSAGIGLTMGGAIRSEGSISIANTLIEQTPSAGLLVQSKALASVDTKGQVGPPGALVTAASLSFVNVTVRDCALRPIATAGVIESAIVLSASARYNYTLGNISFAQFEVSDGLVDRPFLTAMQGPYSAVAGTYDGASIGGTIHARVRNASSQIACKPASGPAVFAIAVRCTQYSP